MDVRLLAVQFVRSLIGHNNSEKAGEKVIRIIQPASKACLRSEPNSLFFFTVDCYTYGLNHSGAGV
jgi:hypothetical protein